MLVFGCPQVKVKVDVKCSTSWNLCGFYRLLTKAGCDSIRLHHLVIKPGHCKRLLIVQSILFFLCVGKDQLWHPDPLRDFLPHLTMAIFTSFSARVRVFMLIFSFMLWRLRRKSYLGDVDEIEFGSNANYQVMWRLNWLPNICLTSLISRTVIKSI